MQLFSDHLNNPSKEIRSRKKFCSHTIWDEFIKVLKVGGKTIGRFKLRKLVRGKWVPLHKDPYKGMKFIKSKKRGRKK